MAALSHTLCETAKLVGLDPEAHLRDALYTVIAGWRDNQQHRFVNSMDALEQGRGRILAAVIRTPEFTGLC